MQHMVIKLFISDWADHSAARWPTSVHSATGIIGGICVRNVTQYLCAALCLKVLEFAHGTRILHIYILGVLFCTTALKAL